MPGLRSASLRVALLLLSSILAAPVLSADSRTGVPAHGDRAWDATQGVTADLVLTLIDAEDGAYAPGATVAIHNVTENIGAETSDAYDIDFYVSLDADITPEDVHLGGYLSLPGIPAGGVDDYIDSLPLPNDLPEASWYVGGIVSTVDADPTNNTNFDATPITVTTDPGGTTADLALTLIDVGAGPYGPGEDIVIHNITENIGAETSNPYDIDFYASLDTTITAEDEHLGGFTSPAIGAGGVDEYHDTLALPGDLAEGSWYIGGIVTTVDADPSNNTNFDATPVTVTTDPEIRVRPLSLDFVEGAAMEPAQTGAAYDADIAVADHEAQSLADLRARAVSEGKVHLIVGLEAPFVPEGRLSQAQAQDQRAAIRAAGQQLRAQLRSLNATVRRQFERIPFLAVTADRRALEHLARSPLVRSIGEDRLSRPTLASSNGVIGSALAWAEGYDGSGWAVAVLDTGVDHGHPWFNHGGPRLVAEGCYGSNEPGQIESLCPAGATSSTAPGSGLSCTGLTGCDHGTHVAGIALGSDGAGPDIGVARGAGLIAMQVFSRFLLDSACGFGQAPCLRSRGSDQIAALEQVLTWSASHDIAAVNMSLGGGMFTDQASCDAASAGIKAAIDNLRSIGIATVVAAGNDGWVDAIGAPGCVSSAVSVGATDDSDQVATFSNVYPEIHLLAPGVGINSSVPGGGVGIKAGTSMATPHVAGAWAVLKQRHPAASVSDALAALQATATPVDDLRPDGIETGMKRINVDLALGEPRTTFGIFNDGPGPLTVTSITPETAAPWVAVEPAPPFEVAAGALRAITVSVNYSLAPVGESQVRLLIGSNDPDESPYPDGVVVSVTTTAEPAPEFESDPAAGATLTFPDTTVGAASAPLTVTVSNAGSASLTLNCGLSGAEASQFVIEACPTPLAPAAAAEISVACNPASAGAKTASLEVSTNDADEANVSFALSCTGTGFPAEETIHADGFEVASP